MKQIDRQIDRQTDKLTYRGIDGQRCSELACLDRAILSADCDICRQTRTAFYFIYVANYFYHKSFSTINHRMLPICLPDITSVPHHGMSSYSIQLEAQSQVSKERVSPSRQSFLTYHHRINQPIQLSNCIHLFHNESEYIV